MHSYPTSTVNVPPTTTAITFSTHHTSHQTNSPFVYFAEDRADFKAFVSDFSQPQAKAFVELYGKKLSNSQRQRLVGLWPEVTRRPGKLKNLVEAFELGELSVEEDIKAVQNEALKCLKNHLFKRPADAKGLRALAAVPYAKGVPEVELLDLMPAGRDTSGPTSDFYNAHVARLTPRTSAFARSPCTRLLATTLRSSDMLFGAQMLQ